MRAIDAIAWCVAKSHDTQISHTILARTLCTLPFYKCSPCISGRTAFSKIHAFHRALLKTFVAASTFALFAVGLRVCAKRERAHHLFTRCERRSSRLRRKYRVACARTASSRRARRRANAMLPATQKLYAHVLHLPPQGVKRDGRHDNKPAANRQREW